jgi:hypothetical protein
VATILRGAGLSVSVTPPPRRPPPLEARWAAPEIDTAGESVGILQSPDGTTR